MVSSRSEIWREGRRVMAKEVTTSEGGGEDKSHVEEIRKLSNHLEDDPYSSDRTQNIGGDSCAVVPTSVRATF